MLSTNWMRVRGLNACSLLTKRFRNLSMSTIYFAREDMEDEEVKEQIKAKFDELRQW